MSSNNGVKHYHERPLADLPLDRYQIQHFTFFQRYILWFVQGGIFAFLFYLMYLTNSSL